MSLYYSDLSNPQILSGIFKKFTVFKNSEEIYDPVGKEFFLQLDLHRMTLSYRKEADSELERIFGYKQIYKYSLKLSEEEKSLAQQDCITGFKLFLENRVFILFSKTIIDFKIWVRSLKSFFDKKFICMMDTNKKIKNESENSSEKCKIFQFREDKQLKIFIETIIAKHSKTIRTKIYKNYTSGLNELNRYFKEYQKMKFMLKMKSDQDKILTQEDIKYVESYFSKINKLKNVMYNNLDPMRIKLAHQNNYIPNYNSNNSNKEFENFPSNNKKENIPATNPLVEKLQENISEKSLNFKTTNNRSESPLLSNPNTSTNFKTYPLIDSSYIQPQQTSPIEIQNYVLTTTLQLTNHKKFESENPNEASVCIIAMPVTQTEIISHPVNNSETYGHITSTARTSKELGVKRDSDTALSTSPTFCSDIYNSRIDDNKIINKNEIIITKQKNELRMSGDMAMNTDDFINFPKLLEGFDKMENFHMAEKKIQILEHKSEIKMVEESLKIESSERKKNDSKSGQVSLDFVPLDRKNHKLQEKAHNKMNLSIDGNFDKKVKIMSNVGERRSAFEVILTPQYGTVSFIAQRFEKIDIDEWRVDY